MTKSPTSRAFSGHCKISRSPVDSSTPHRELWQLTHSAAAGRGGLGGGESEVFQFLRHGAAVWWGARLPVSVSLHTLHANNIYHPPSFWWYFFTSLRIGWRLWCWWWSVMVTRGVTETRTLDIGTASLICLMSHLSRYNQIHRHTGRGHRFMRCNAMFSQWMRECF